MIHMSPRGTNDLRYFHHGLASCALGKSFPRLHAHVMSRKHRNRIAELAANLDLPHQARILAESHWASQCPAQPARLISIGQMQTPCGDAQLVALRWHGNRKRMKMKVRTLWMAVGMTMLAACASTLDKGASPMPDTADARFVQLDRLFQACQYDQLRDELFPRANQGAPEKVGQRDTKDLAWLTYVASNGTPLSAFGKDPGTVAMPAWMVASRCTTTSP